MYSAAILAGGRARRFGGIDKSALVVDGERILDRQMRTLGAVAGLNDVLLVGARANHAGARTVPDRISDRGPLGGIHAALSEARNDLVFVLACDMPFVSAPLVEHLFALAGDADLVVPRTEAGYHPLCAVYSRNCLEAIARRLGEGRLKVIDLVDDVRVRVVMGSEIDGFGDSHRLLSNVNTPLDHAALQASHGHEL